MGPLKPVEVLIERGFCEKISADSARKKWPKILFSGKDEITLLLIPVFTVHLQTNKLNNNNNNDEAVSCWPLLSYASSPRQQHSIA